MAERTTYTYRIHTEDVGDHSVETIVSVYFDGFTVLRGRGYWKGEAEDAMIIEIISAEPFMQRTLGKIAKQINRLNDQEACMITRTATTLTLETGRP